MKKVACVGILVADIIVETVSEYPKNGILMPVNSITLHNGGNAMTASVNIKKLGIETSIIGKVGSDIFGSYLINRLNEHGINTSGLKTDSSVQTSASVLMIDKSGERSFFHCEGTNGCFSIKDVDWDIIKSSDIVFVTGTYLLKNFDGSETAEFFKRCKEMGKTTFSDVCWDSSNKWGELLVDAMPYIDCFMPSIDEAVNISQKNSYEDIADDFLKKGVKNTVIKLGSKGCYVKCGNSSANGVIYPAASGIKAIDTTGAGDSFCSGFIAAYARGNDIDFCAKFANAAGGKSVTEKGATSAIKSYDDVLDFMNTIYKNNTQGRK